MSPYLVSHSKEKTVLGCDEQDHIQISGAYVLQALDSKEIRWQLSSGQPVAPVWIVFTLTSCTG